MRQRNFNCIAFTLGFLVALMTMALVTRGQAPVASAEPIEPSGDGQGL